MVRLGVGLLGLSPLPWPCFLGSGEVAGSTSRKTLGAGLPSKAVLDQWDREPHRG